MTHQSLPLLSRKSGRLAIPPAALLIVALAALPILSLAFLALGDTGDVWAHLAVNVLPRAAINTALLLAGVAAVTAALGIGSAWLVSQHDFPLRSLVHWLLVLPLAIPTYISAYCFVEFMGFTGPAQSLIRTLAGYRSASEYWFPDIRSLPGAIFVMGIVLYPYVYLTCRVLFDFQGRSMLEAGRLLGAGKATLFFRIALPMARPAVIAGVALALMEALNDIGAVEFLGVRTLTFAIYDTWLARSSLAGAAQIACLLLILAVLLLQLERRARGGRSYAPKDLARRPAGLVRLDGAKGIAAMTICLVPPVLGFIVPASVLLRFGMARLDQLLEPQLHRAALNSVEVATLSALATAAAALVLVASVRPSSPPMARGLLRIATLGYAIPGSVLGVGVLYAFTTFDNALDGFMRNAFGIATGLLISGSSLIVVYAASVRFTAVAHGAIEAGHQRISGREALAARTLGRNFRQAFFAVELPLLRPALLTALLLVFVETMKELSATILLRPFNFPTLATHVYELASRARFEDAAIASMIIVAIGAVPVVLVSSLQSAIGKEKGGL